MYMKLQDYVNGLKGVDAPYNFVPLNRNVFRDPEAFRVTQDIPFEDGISGRLLIELETVTPTCVGNKQSKAEGKGGPSQVEPLRLADGRLAISGSSLRGAIRSVLEIASFSRMRRYDNPAMSLRDLAGPVSEIYRKKLVDGFRYKGHAGWLQKTDQGWCVRKCRMSRVSHLDMYEYSNKKWRGFEGRKRAEEKYKEWIDACDSLSIRFDAVEEVDAQSNIQASFAKQLGKDAKSEGVLVVTGQPGGYNVSQLGATTQKKCREFIFHGAEDTLQVDENVLAGFFQVHKESEDLEFLRGSWYQRQVGPHPTDVQLRIPVFFLEDEARPGMVESMGLALMYRMPYKHDFQYAVGNSSQDHHQGDFDDLGSLLFGAIDGKNKTGLKGRLHFQTLKSADSEVALEPHRVVLNGPKPSFYPAYLEQPGQDKGKLPSQSYRTLQDDNALVRGRKRYPARPEHQERATGNNKLDSVLHCVPSGTRFTGAVVFHNLRPFELGALLWSLTFGKRESCHHNMGSGKPYGLGQVRISVGSIECHYPPGTGVDDENLMKCFVTRMEDWARTPEVTTLKKGWFNSEEIQNLIAMADPASAARWEAQTGCGLRYLRPQGQGFGDKDMPQLHQKIKGAGLVLTSYADNLPEVLEQAVDPEIERWVDDQVVDIAKANRSSADEALRGKVLYGKVAEIDDPDQKKMVAECIKAKLKARGFWDEPGGKAAKRTKTGYQEILGESA